MTTNKWKDFVEKNLFTTTEDFYHLPYLSNSPLIKIKSIIDISVATHNVDLQTISTKNPLCSGVLRYRNIEDGLWLLSTTLALKKNIVAKTYYDTNFDSDFYYLSFSIFEYNFPSIKGSGPKKLLSKCWTFYKPQTEVSTYFYKDTVGTFYNIVFSKKWAEHNIPQLCGKNASTVLKFLNAETGFLSCLDIVPNMSKIATKIDFMLKNKNVQILDVSSLKPLINTLVSDFFKVVIDQNRIQNYVPVKNEDYDRAAQAEKIILQNLSKPFVGVLFLSESVHLSPTKLKTIFKMVFGLSMLQYHKQKNLQLAMQLLLKSEVPIKYIATISGYGSSSKFTAAFKQNFSVLPSEMRK